MQVKTYIFSFVFSCLSIGFVVWALFMLQAYLPLNPNHAPNMSWDLALHSMISFLTNTNQQHYSGQAQLSYLSQMVGIVGLQIITPMMGLAMVVATVRALFFKPAVTPIEASAVDESFNEKIKTINVGNYWADVIRPTFRFLLPLCVVWALFLNSQGVPATLKVGLRFKYWIRPRHSARKKFHSVLWHRWWRLSNWAVMAAVGMAQTVVCL